MCDHLLRRGARYYIRRKIPADLLVVLGRKEYVKALGTSDPKEAARLCRIESVRLDAEWQALRAASEAQHAIAHASASARTTARKRAAEDQQRAFEDAQDYYYQHVKDEGFEEEEAEAVEEAIKREMYVKQEAKRRLKAAKQPQKPPSGTRLIDLVGRWERERQPSPRSARAVTLTAEYFVKHIGAVPVERIARANVIAFRQAMLDSGQSPVNTGKHLAQLKTLLGYALSTGLLESNPAQGVRIESRSDPRDARRPFGPDHIRAILAASPGDNDPAHFWLPRLLLWTGARVNELAQLRVSDIQQAELLDGRTVPVISISSDAEGQSIKNAGSRRRVPLAPALLAAGFLDYVESRHAAGADWLFDLTADQYGNRSSSYVRWFGRWLRGPVGITDTRLTGHSFRHAFAASCRECGIAENVTSALMGHVGGSVQRRYGGTFPLTPLVEAIERLRIIGATPSKSREGHDTA